MPQDGAIQPKKRDSKPDRACTDRRARAETARQNPAFQSAISEAQQKRAALDHGPAEQRNNEIAYPAKRHDTLSGIAQCFQLPLSQLRGDNPQIRPRFLQIGQPVFVRQPEATPTDQSKTAAPVDQSKTAAPAEQSKTVAPVDRSKTAAPVDEPKTEAPRGPVQDGRPIDEAKAAAEETKRKLDAEEAATKELAGIESEIAATLGGAATQPKLTPEQQKRLLGAQQKLGQALQEAGRALEREASLELTQRMRKDAAAKGTGPRKASPAQIDAAIGAVLARHKRLKTADGAHVTQQVLTWGMAQKLRPAFDARLAALNPNDPQHPKWFKTLAAKDPVQAVLIDGLGQAKAQPQNEAERQLLEKDPLAFATLKFTGASLPEARWGAFHDAESFAKEGAQVAGYSVQQLAQSNPEAYSTFHSLMRVAGDVRAERTEAEVTRLLREQTPEADVDQRVKDPDAAHPTKIEAALQIVRDNVKASLTPEQQEQIWSRVGPQIKDYIGRQSAHLKTLPSGQQAKAYGTWLKGVAQQADPMGARLALDRVLHDVPRDMLYRGPGRTWGSHSRELVEGLQVAVDHAPDKAAEVARWAFPAGQPANPMYPRPSRAGPPLPALVTAGENGTGLALTSAVLQQLKDTGGLDRSRLDRLGEEFKQAADQWFGDQARSRNAFFNKDAKVNVQQMFDDLAERNGDLFSKQHDFAALNEVQRKDLIGAALFLPPDNESPAAGESRYTDEQKLAQIGQVEAWIKEAAGDKASVQFMPAIYSSDKQGVMTLPLIKVKGDADGDGEMEEALIDGFVASAGSQGKNVPWRYDNFESWRRENPLDDEGKLYLSNAPDMLLHYANGGQPGADGRKHVAVDTNGIEAAITTGWEKWRRRLDIGIAAVAGTAAIIGTGGLATPWVFAVAIGYGAGRLIETRSEMIEHGQSFNPINRKDPDAWFGAIDPTAGGLYLSAAATVAGGVAIRPFSLISRTTQTFRGASLTAADRYHITATRAIDLRHLSTGRMENFLGKGAQATLYKDDLRKVGMGWANIAITTGTADMTAQVYQMGQAIGDGSIDLTDMSLFGGFWDGFTLGSNTVPIAAGFAVRNSHHRPMQPGAEGALEQQIRLRTDTLMGEASAAAGERARYHEQARHEVLGIDKAIAERAQTLKERAIAARAKALSEADKPSERKVDADYQARAEEELKTTEYRAQAEADIRTHRPQIEERAAELQRLQSKPEHVAESQAKAEVESLYRRIEEEASDIEWRQSRALRRNGDRRPQDIGLTSLAVAEHMIQRAQPAIARRAHELWEQAGHPDGDGLGFWKQEGVAFWKQAEQEVLYGMSFVKESHYGKDHVDPGKLDGRDAAEIARKDWEAAGKPAGKEQEFLTEARHAVVRRRENAFHTEYLEEHGREPSSVEIRNHLEGERMELADAKDSYFLINGRWRQVETIPGLIGEMRRTAPTVVGATTRADGTQIPGSLRSFATWVGFGAVPRIVKDTWRRMTEASARSTYGGYSHVGDHVDGAFGMAVDLPAGSRMIIDVDGQKVETTVSQVKLPKKLHKFPRILTPRARQLDTLGVFDPDKPSLKGKVIVGETEFQETRIGTTGQDGQTRGNSRGIQPEGNKDQIGVLSEAGARVARFFLEPDVWGPETVADARDLVKIGLRSSDPRFRAAAEDVARLLPEEISTDARAELGALLKASERATPGEKQHDALRRALAEKPTHWTWPVLKAARDLILEGHSSGDAPFRAAAETAARSLPDNIGADTRGRMDALLHASKQASEGNASRSLRRTFAEAPKRWTEELLTDARNLAEEGLRSSSPEFRAAAEAAVRQLPSNSRAQTRRLLNAPIHPITRRLIGDMVRASGGDWGEGSTRKVLDGMSSAKDWKDHWTESLLSATDNLVSEGLRSDSPDFRAAAEKVNDQLPDQIGDDAHTRMRALLEASEKAGEAEASRDLLRRSLEPMPMHWTEELLADTANLVREGLGSDNPAFQGAAEAAPPLLPERFGENISIDARGRMEALLQASEAAGEGEASRGLLHRALESGPTHWTKAFRDSVENYLRWAEGSFSGHARFRAWQARSTLGATRLPEVGSKITDAQRWALHDPETGMGLLQVDMESRFTGSKVPGSVSPNSQRMLLALFAQSGAPLRAVARAHGDMSQADFAAFVDPASPSRLTSDNLAGWKWSEAGWSAVVDHLREASRSTDDRVRQRAADALLQFENRRTNDPEITKAQADAILDFLQAEYQSRWVSGNTIPLHPSYVGTGRLSAEGLDLGDHLAALSPQGWANLRRFVGVLRNSDDRAVSAEARDVYEKLPKQAPKPHTPESGQAAEQLAGLATAMRKKWQGSAEEGAPLLPEMLAQRDLGRSRLHATQWKALEKVAGRLRKSSDRDVQEKAESVLAEVRRMRQSGPDWPKSMSPEMLLSILELAHADRQSPHWEPRSDVVSQMVTRPDRSTISQYVQESPDTLVLRYFVNLGAPALISHTTGLPAGPWKIPLVPGLVFVNFPFPGRQAYAELSSSSPETKPYLKAIHPNDAEGQEKYSFGFRLDPIFDDNGDPDKPWIIPHPMKLKVTFQQEQAFGVGWWPAPPFPLTVSLNKVWRTITYPGTADGRPGYVDQPPMRYSDADFALLDGAFQGGGSYLSQEGTRPGAEEYPLFRNYRSFRVWDRWRGPDQHRQGFFAQLPRDKFLGDSFVQIREDRPTWGGEVGMLVPPGQLFTRERGAVHKYMVLEPRPITPSPDGSPLQRDAVGELQKSGGEWTSAAIEAMQRWYEAALKSENPRYRAAGRRVQSALEPESTLDRDDRNRLLQDAEAWARQEDSQVSAQARAAQRRYAEEVARRRVTSPQWEYINALLEADEIDYRQRHRVNE